MDSEQQRAKENIDHEVATQISDTNNHLNKTKEKNVTHSQEFKQDIKQVEENQRQIYDELLKVSLDDVTGCKTNISEKINGEITLIKNETQQMDDQQHQKIDQEIKLFTEEIGRVDNEQHKSIDDQIALFNSECNAMEEKLHKMLNVHKTQYKENATSLQQSLTTTVKDNVQSVKDAIADFTLNFMNAIDESTEKSQNNEEKLLTIVNAAANVEKIEAFTTWHVIGREPLISAICDTMWRTKSSIIIVTPNVEEKVLEHLSQAAYKKKNARFFYTTNWDLQTWGPVINKMKALGNIQFRNLKTTGEFYAVARDAEEVILGPNAKDPKDLVSIVSTQEGYCQLYSAFIGPIFQANSRPI
jgi:hypothetical protein